MEQVSEGKLSCSEVVIGSRVVRLAALRQSSACLGATQLFSKSKFLVGVVDWVERCV